MLEESVVVTAREGEFARVETRRSTACGGCAAKSACGTSVLAKVWGNRRASLRVLNPIDAGPGEKVIIGLEESTLTRASFVFYLVPLLSLILAAILGREFAGWLNLSAVEPVSMLSGLLGLLLGLVWLRHYATRTSHDRRHQAVILRRAGGSEIRFDAGGGS
jgi:sigma-E factor negative regulatory protein RseC